MNAFTFFIYLGFMIPPKTHDSHGSQPLTTQGAL